jgi:hypothetical protein
MLVDTMQVFPMQPVRVRMTPPPPHRSPASGVPQKRFYCEWD